MGTKCCPGTFDCYARALPHEPLFTFLARDCSAPELLSTWATRREALVRHQLAPESDLLMTAEARLCAHAMVIWRRTNYGIWRLDRDEAIGRERLVDYALAQS